MQRLNLLLLLFMAQFSSPPAAASEVEDVIDLQAINRFWQAGEPHQSFVGKDGIEIAYKVFRHPDSTKAVVIASGRTESFIKYKELSWELYQQGYSVYQHDHRGQGLSGRMLEDRLKGHVLSFDDYLVDMETFMDEVVLPSEHQRLYLFGHSMGGSIAIRYLARHPQVFNAVALGAPMLAPNTGPPGTCALASGIALFCGECSVPRKKPKPIKQRFEENRLTHSLTRFRLVSEAYSAYPEARLSAPTYGWVAQACAIRDDLLADAESIKTPLLLMQAGAEAVVLNKPQNAFCSIIGARGKPVCVGGAPFVVEGASHELLFEQDSYRNIARDTMLGFFQQNQ